MRHTRPALGPATLRPTTRRPGNHGVPMAARTGRPRPAAHHHPYERDARLATLEALLMAADEPLSLRKLAGVPGLGTAADVRKLVETLGEFLTADGSAFEVREVAGGFRLATRAAFHPWLLRLRRSGHELRLTPTLMETLAVIAYKQPVTRADVEAVRGVACAEPVRVLVERGLVRTAGRQSSLGRPQLYATTDAFLRQFGLLSLDELPQAEELRTP